MTIIIGLVGPKRVGKTTLATFICKSYGAENVQLFAYGDFLKELTGLAMSLPASVFHDPDLKEVPLTTHKGFTPRQMLQQFGDLCKVFDSNIFIKPLEKCVKLAIGRKVKIVLVTDVRFEAEAKAIKDLNGILIRITNGNGMKSNQDNHVSETAHQLIKTHYILENVYGKKNAFIDNATNLISNILE